MTALTRLSRVRPVPYGQAFLIPDLLGSSVTMLAGEPKAGKTNLAAAMSRALLDGTEFLGRPARKVNHIVWGLTDAGAEEELRMRFEGTAALDGISFLTLNDLSAEQWAELPTSLRDAGCDLFVIDNMLGTLAAGEDIASGVTAQNFVTRLRPIVHAGIAMLVITHTPKGNGEGLTVSSSVMGGRAIAGFARGVIALRSHRQKGLRLETKFNRGRSDLDLPVRLDMVDGTEVPVWSLRRGRGASTGATPSQDAGAMWDALADRIAAEQPEIGSLAGLGKAYAGSVSRHPNTVRAQLTGRLRHDGVRWVRDHSDLTGSSDCVDLTVAA